MRDRNKNADVRAQATALRLSFRALRKEHIMYLDFPVLSSICHFSYYFRSVTKFILFIDEIFALPFDSHHSQDNYKENRKFPFTEIQNQISQPGEEQLVGI